MNYILRRILEVAPKTQNRRYGSVLHSLNMQMISCANGSLVLATNKMTDDVFRVI
jgi:hypothetical protein